MEEWIDVASVAEVPPGTRQAFQTPELGIIIVNLDGTFYALEDVCSHDGGILSDGWLAEDALVCPRHGARFCVKTGEPLSPPAYEAINTYPVLVEHGRIKVKLR